jgi:hypothetical protein
MAGREKTTILEDSSLRKSRIFLGEVLAKNGSAGKIANLLHRLRLDDGGNIFKGFRIRGSKKQEAI